MSLGDEREDRPTTEAGISIWELDPLALVEKLRRLSPDQVRAVNEQVVREYTKETVGELLQSWRKQCGMKLEEVEAALGDDCKASYLSKVERGKLPPPRLDTLILLARTYRVPLWMVFSQFSIVFQPLQPLLPGSQEDQDRLRQTEAAFEYVLAMPDFAAPGKAVSKTMLRALPPEAKLLMINLYERATGMVLVRPGTATPSGRHLPEGEIYDERRESSSTDDRR